MPANVTALSFEYSGASTRLAAASTDAIVAVGRVSGGSTWTSAAGWLFRGSVARRLEVILEGAEVLETAANALLVLDGAVSQAESEMATAQLMLAQPLSTNPFALTSSFVVIPGQAELAGATSRRDEAYRRAAETLTALALSAPISERYHADYVEQQLRKDGIDIEVRVQDGVIVNVDWDGLSGKKMWKVMSLTEAGREAQADLKDSAGYDDGFFSLKTWSPYHGGGRIAIAYMEGDELRMFLEGVGAVPLPGAGGVAKVGVKVVGKISAKVSGKVASKVAAKVSAKVAKKVSKEVSKDVSAKVAAETATEAAARRAREHSAKAAGEAREASACTAQGARQRRAALAAEAAENANDMAARRAAQAADEFVVTLPSGPGSRLAPGGGLLAHEGDKAAKIVGGHTIAHLHIGATEHQLAQRLLRRPKITGASSYYNRAAAEHAVSMTLEANETAIRHWMLAGAPRSGNAFFLDMGRPVGISLERGAANVVPATRVRVVLQPDATKPGGYFILTSYPEVRFL